MYSAARTCTEGRVDGAADAILFVLEKCSELMLPLASLTRCFARSARAYPRANSNPWHLQPWFYFQQHGSLDSLLAPPADANRGHFHDAVASCSFLAHGEIPDCV